MVNIFTVLICHLYIVLDEMSLHCFTHFPFGSFAFFTVELWGLFVSACVWAKLLQDCSILCDPKDCTLPGSSGGGILQARTLEWVAIPSSRGSSWPMDRLNQHHLCLWHWQEVSLSLAPYLLDTDCQIWGLKILPFDL